MADKTKIPWTGATWNIINGCSIKSPGCKKCYAMRLAATRLRNHPSRKGLAVMSKAGPVWTGETRFYQPWLDQPIRWTTPREIFVCAHGDLFHESNPLEWIDKVFAVAAVCQHHIFQVLTKRSGQMRAYWLQPDTKQRIEHLDSKLRQPSSWDGKNVEARRLLRTDFPLPNVWSGVSIEDQSRVDERFQDLIETPSAVRWISAEPMLEPLKFPRVDFHCYLCGGTGLLGYWPGGKCHECDGKGKIPALSTDPAIGGPTTPMRRVDQIVVGCESGPRKRAFDEDWARDILKQCEDTGTAFFNKQMPHPSGTGITEDMDLFPQDLRVRERPVPA